MACHRHSPPQSRTWPSPLWNIQSTCCYLPTWTAGSLTLTFASLLYLRQTQWGPFPVYSGAEAQCQPAAIPEFNCTRTTLGSPTWRQTSCVWCQRTAKLRTSHLWQRGEAWKATTTRGCPYETSKPGKTKGKCWSITSPFVSPPCLTTTTTCFSSRKPWRYTGKHCAKQFFFHYIPAIRYQQTPNQPIVLTLKFFFRSLFVIKNVSEAALHWWP